MQEYIMIGFGIYLVLMFVWLFSAEKKFDKDKKNLTRKIKAIITSVESYNNSCVDDDIKEILVKYSYIVNGSQYTGTGWIVERIVFLFPYKYEGKKVIIYYNPQNPSESMTAHWKRTRGTSSVVWALIIVSICLVIALFGTRL